MTATQPTPGGAPGWGVRESPRQAARPAPAPPAAAGPPPSAVPGWTARAMAAPRTGLTLPDEAPWAAGAPGQPASGRIVTLGNVTVGRNHVGDLHVYGDCVLLTDYGRRPAAARRAPRLAVRGAADGWRRHVGEAVAEWVTRGNRRRVDLATPAARLSRLRALTLDAMVRLHPGAVRAPFSQVVSARLTGTFHWRLELRTVDGRVLRCSGHRETEPDFRTCVALIRRLVIDPLPASAVRRVVPVGAVRTAVRGAIALAIVGAPLAAVAAAVPRYLSDHQAAQRFGSAPPCRVGTSPEAAGTTCIASAPATYVRNDGQTQSNPPQWTLEVVVQGGTSLDQVQLLSADAATQLTTPGPDGVTVQRFGGNITALARGGHTYRTAFNPGDLPGDDLTGAAGYSLVAIVGGLLVWLRRDRRVATPDDQLGLAHRA